MFLKSPLSVPNVHSKVSLGPALLQAEQTQLKLFQPFLTGEVLLPLDYLCSTPLDPLQQLHVFPVLRAPELNTGLQVGSHKAEQMGRIPSLDLLALLLLMQPRIRLAVWAVNAQCQVMLNLLSTSTPKSSFSGLLSIHSPPSLYLCLGLPQPMCRTLHLTLLNLVRFAQAHFLILSRSLWVTSFFSSVSTAPHSLVSSVNLLRVHSVPLSMLLTKRLNSTVPRTQPWGTPLVTGVHLDIEPLTATRSVWPRWSSMHSSWSLT